MKKIVKRVYLFLQRYRCKKIDVRFGSNVDFYNASFEGTNRIGNNTRINSTKIGFASYTGNDCVLSKCDIGRFCSIGNNVKVIYGTHPVNNFYSTHPAFYSTKRQVNLSFVSENKFNENNETKAGTSCSIGSDVWIGDSVHILEGVSIGTGSIVGACSFVNRDVPPYAIVAGVPAKIKRYRFSDEEIKNLLSSMWWDMDILDYKSIKALDNIKSRIEGNI